MIIVCLSIINLVLKRLRLFEKDVDDYENDNTDDAEPVKILARRKKYSQDKDSEQLSSNSNLEEPLLEKTMTDSNEGEEEEV